jgi:hypothetical protein
LIAGFTRTVTWLQSVGSMTHKIGIHKFTWTAAACAALLVASFSLSGQERGKGPINRGKRPPQETEAPQTRPLPDDKRLLSLHLEFVKSAEKLGKEYEGSKDWGKARTVYEEILKLVPQYKPAAERLAAMREHESNAQSEIVNVKATEGWQDTGIELMPGKPVSITATGSWTFHLELETNAEGLTIPKELRDFNPGCLVGMIPDQSDPENNKPFVIGSSKRLELERGGKLFLRMYDTDPRDNDGALKVEIRGTFKGGK